jgi:hypothetical protein
MTTPDPTADLNTLYNSLQRDIQSLQAKVRLIDARGALEDLDTRIKGFPQAVTNLRSRKYAFEASLEGKASEILQRWNANRPSVDLFIEQQAVLLETAIRPLETRLSYLSGQLGNPGAVMGLAKELETDVTNLENKVSAAVNTAAQMYDELSSQFNILSQHLDEINYTLDQVEQACFKLLPTESAVMAIKAAWTRDGHEDRDDPQGVLFLTDQRLFFEQKQEVATKKVLFITTERKMVQQVLLEFPAALVRDIKGTKQGLFKNEDFLEISLASGAQVQSAVFHIFGQNFQTWISLINRVISHEFDKDRAIPLDQSEVERIKSAPTACPRCNGSLPKVILRGQDSITCEYCGETVRL